MENGPLVALAACPDYTGARVRDAVHALLAHWGGMGAFVSRGNRVLIKPNLLTARRPEEAVTTHPEVVRAVIREVRDAGGDPAVADSPANVSKVEQVWARTGIGALCEAEGVPLLSLEKAGSRPVERDGFTFSVAQPVLDADVVISIPKVKTHVLTILTGAVKNVYGTIPGFQKTELHRRHPDVRGFGRLLAAVYATVRPRLSLADGVVGMEGDGPSGGSPAALGWLAAAEDAVALDAVLCAILAIRPRAVPTFAPLAAAGLGTADMARIRVRGLSLADARPRGFRVPGTLRGRLIPAWLIRLLGPALWIRPAIRADRCIHCGQCAAACPVGALTARDGAPPALNPRICIGCCCCHEICPAQAIAMRMGTVLSLVRRGRLP
jgi:uncharacterized protein (DUF362 family)/Pyruvate/2-oxoacid:ferredoxin oxidoreductase delta subunit